MLKQYELKDPESESTMVCWLEHDPRVKLHSMLSLKEIPGVLWVVAKIYEGERNRSDIKRGWNNNI